MEDFVTYEQALQLKELGFDRHNRYTQMYYATQCYCEGNNPIYFDTIGPGDLISSPKMKEDENNGWIEDEDYCVLAPTLYEVQKWLLDKFDIDIDIIRDDTNNVKRYICKVWHKNRYGDYTFVYAFSKDERFSQYFLTREDALRSAIDEALTLQFIRLSK